MRHPAPRYATQGFTMIELVIVIVLLGILSVTVLPRLSGSSEFRIAQLRDEVAAAVRFAQKTAVSHRRKVCIDVSGDELSLRIAQTHAGACDTALAIPGGAATVRVNGVSLSVIPTTLVIEPSGQVVGNGSLTYEFSIGGGEYTLTLWAETGHVE